MGVEILLSGSIGRVLYEKAKQFHWTGQGSTSIKSFFNGAAEYRLSNGIERVDSGRYLLLNDHQPYSITIDSQEEVESFCVFFLPQSVNRAAFEFVCTDNRILDDPFCIPSQSVEFLDKTYWHDDLVTPVLQSLRANFHSFGHDPMWLDEQLCRLLNRMLFLHTKVVEQMNKISSVRKSTREELFRRVSIAHDLIMEKFRHKLALGDLSREAMMSENHLLRTYKEVFGISPHQQIIALRLREARRLLRETNLPVSEVCVAVGFESLGSFSAAFHRNINLSPLVYRKLGDF